MFPELAELLNAMADALAKLAPESPETARVQSAQAKVMHLAMPGVYPGGQAPPPAPGGPTW
jgi:hypothetical protein